MEKFVRFQEPRCHETDRPALLSLLTQFNFLKRNDPEYVSKVLASKELFELLETRRTAFWWKAGRYDLTIKLSSPRKFRLTQSRFACQLTSTDIDHLRQNVEALTTDIQNVINSNLPDFQEQPLNWNWASVNIQNISARNWHSLTCAISSHGQFMSAPFKNTGENVCTHQPAAYTSA